MSRWELRLRFLAVRAVILGTFLVLGLRLWQLQILRRDEFQMRADRQRFRIEAIDAPRGVFYDRNQRLLVVNVPRFVVSITWANLPQDEAAQGATLERLSSLLGIPVSREQPRLASLRGVRDIEIPPAPEPVDLESLVEEARKRPFEPYPVAVDVDRQLAFVIMEEQPQLPGVSVQVQATRSYLDGPLMAHILGYMWRMPKEEVSYYTSLPHSDYTPNDQVGYSGLERTMETTLHGRRGLRMLEVDLWGREVSVLDTLPPQPGNSVILTIDRNLQAATEQFLKQGMSGAHGDSAVAIVMSPRTGEVLSMVSLPTYDNRLFAEGKIEAFSQLLNDPAQPMFNRAIAGQYAPGSTFKIVPATAALQERVIDRRETLTCEGILTLEAYGQWLFYCWIHKYGVGHGNVNIVDALAQSCDIYFYKLAGGYKDFRGLGLDVMNHYARMFGLGEPTGIELSGEEGGLVPTAKWKRLNINEVWTTGDTYNAAIGQGYVLATPLQMVNALCAVANGGTLYRPTLVREIVDANGNVVRPFQPQAIRKLDVSPEVLAVVEEGLRKAVTDGTARLMDLGEVTVASKTGTAEYGVADEKGTRPTHAWLMAYAPVEDPEVAVIVFIEGGGEGSSAAAPVAAQILRYYFGLP
ncbi:MAG: penicillin-binding protein 2, partial [Anaerolineae bacterium]|nr:penicillin-binding protein 2 [Anaerolineae bacterium]